MDIHIIFMENKFHVQIVLTVKISRGFCFCPACIVLTCVVHGVGTDSIFLGCCAQIRNVHKLRTFLGKEQVSEAKQDSLY